MIVEKHSSVVNILLSLVSAYIIINEYDYSHTKLILFLVISLYTLGVFIMKCKGCSITISQPTLSLNFWGHYNTLTQ